ncbi:hypothetical protein BC332_08728 [Capsicum chinense]|nr:hypothetical protein BC332_08728 [Capsicum chinense]
MQMEGNKDEAVRAKRIAEQKLTEKDIAGAQEYALKAQILFPGLDGLSQFLEVVAVYVAHEKKIHGEVDIYRIFSVEPSVDDETIRKQYRRLSLALHPDKNKSVGADGAFKIISEAWSLLYDSRRAKRNASMKGNQHRFHNFSNASTQPYATPTAARQAAHRSQPAHAILKRPHAEAAPSALNQEAFLKKSVSFIIPDSVSTCSEADHKLIKKRRTAVVKAKFQGKGMANELAAKGGSSSQGIIHRNENGVLRAKRVAVVGSNKPSSSGKSSSSIEIRNMLMNKARMEIKKKLTEWSTTAASSKKEKEVMKKKNQIIQKDLRKDKTAHGVADTSKLERACGESKEKDKSYVVCHSNVAKGEDTPKDSMSVVKQPILTYSRKKKVKAEASIVEAKR